MTTNRSIKFIFFLVISAALYYVCAESFVTGRDPNVAITVAGKTYEYKYLKIINEVLERNYTDENVPFWAFQERKIRNYDIWISTDKIKENILIVTPIYKMRAPSQGGGWIYWYDISQEKIVKTLRGA